MQPRSVHSRFHDWNNVVQNHSIDNESPAEHNQRHADHFKALADQMHVDNAQVMEIFEKFLNYMRVKSERARSKGLIDNLLLSDQLTEQEKGRRMRQMHRECSNVNYAYGRWIDDKRAELAFREIMQNEIDRREGRYTDPGIFQPPALFEHQKPVDYIVFPRFEDVRNWSRNDERRDINEEEHFHSGRNRLGFEMGMMHNVNGVTQTTDSVQNRSMESQISQQRPDPSSNYTNFGGVQISSTLTPQRTLLVPNDYSTFYQPSNHDIAYSDILSPIRGASMETRPIEEQIYHPPGYCTCKESQRKPPQPNSIPQILVSSPRASQRTSRTSQLLEPTYEPDPAPDQLNDLESSREDVTLDNPNRECYCADNKKVTSRRKRSKGKKNQSRSRRHDECEEEITVEVNNQMGQLQPIVKLRTRTPERTPSRRRKVDKSGRQKRQKNIEPSQPETIPTYSVEDDLDQHHTIESSAEYLPPPDEDGPIPAPSNVRPEMSRLSFTDRHKNHQLQPIEEINDVIALQRQAFYSGFEYAWHSSGGGLNRDQEFFMVRSRFGGKVKERGVGTVGVTNGE